jgi:hypothetical protein
MDREGGARDETNEDDAAGLKCRLNEYRTVDESEAEPSTNRIIFILTGTEQRDREKGTI